MIPYTDYEKLALLEEIQTGVKVVLPVDIEHAKFMLMVAQQYINACHQETFDILKAEFK